MFKQERNKGITLVALVITIIVLLILAGVTINLVFGENGIINKASVVGEEAKRTSAREELIMMVADYKIEKHENNQLTFEGYFQDKVDNIVNNGDDTYTVEYKGYEFLIDDVNGTVEYIGEARGIRAIAQSKIYQTDGQETVDGIQYKQLAVTIKITNKAELGTIDSITMKKSNGDEITKQASLIGDTTAEASYIVDKKGTYTLRIQTTTDGITKTTTLKIQVTQIETYWAETSKTDSSWYNYGNAKVNTPALMGKMTPVIYEGPEAQQITGNKWANVETADGSMFVWIPRYAYKITEGYHTNTAGKIEVKFIDTDNNFLDGTPGKPETDPSKITYSNGTTGSQNEWLVHPAFTSSAENGGGFGEVEGLWIGKFETRKSNSILTITAGESSLEYAMINEKYQGAKTATFGETVDLKSHMMKNSEWGVATYLAHSDYGTKGSKIEFNETTITGGSTNKTEIYTTNKLQSTTHNAYGIYDLNGAQQEIVASYVNNGNANLSTGGGTKAGDLYGATADERATSTEYKTVYKTGGTHAVIYGLTAGIKGDAIYETSNSAWSSTGSWYLTVAYTPYATGPFFARGRYSNESNTSSSFHFTQVGGSNKGHESYHIVCVP